MLNNIITPFISSFDKSTIRSVRTVFPLNRPGLTTYFSPILGQFAIKNTDFINEFITKYHIVTRNAFKDVFEEGSEETGFYDEELMIPVNIIVYKAGKFNLQVDLPALGFLYSTYFNKRRRIYKCNSRGFLWPYRNYKKLFQIVLLRALAYPTNNLLLPYINNSTSNNSSLWDLERYNFSRLPCNGYFHLYKLIRNSLNQKK